MENSKQLADRTREVYLSGKWIAFTNFQELLKDLNWEQATHKIGTLNTIADLTFHVTYYLGGVSNVFAGGKLEIRDKYSFDYQPIQTEEDWQKLRSDFLQTAETFANYIEAMPDEQLNECFVDEKYDNYHRNIEAMIEHGYYHLGQVALIKKMIGKKEKKGAH